MKTPLLICTLAVLGLAGCHSVELNDDRIPRMPVYVPFTTVSEWHAYGIGGEYGAGGAMQWRRFIRAERVPSGYPWPDYSYTGFGGVLLSCDVNSELHVFDLACPVERLAQVRVYITDNNYARCPKCGSEYDVFRIERSPGAPVSGPALADGYALRRYRIAFGADGRYALLTN